MCEKLGWASLLAKETQVSASKATFSILPAAWHPAVLLIAAATLSKVTGGLTSPGQGPHSVEQSLPLILEQVL